MVYSQDLHPQVGGNDNLSRSTQEVTGQSPTPGSTVQGPTVRWWARKAFGFENQQDLLSGEPWGYEK